MKCSYMAIAPLNSFHYSSLKILHGLEILNEKLTRKKKVKKYIFWRFLYAAKLAKSMVREEKTK